jgi:hypothetical protein
MELRAEVCQKFAQKRGLSRRFGLQRAPCVCGASAWRVRGAELQQGPVSLGGCKGQKVVREVVGRCGT